MPNAIYKIYFSGLYGNGMGTITLQNGEIIGADSTGITTIEGHYTIGNARIMGTIILHSPPGTILVTGASSGTDNGYWPIPFDLPSDLGKGVAMPLRTPTGFIQILFKKVRDL